MASHCFNSTDDVGNDDEAPDVDEESDFIDDIEDAVIEQIERVEERLRPLLDPEITGDGFVRAAVDVMDSSLDE